MTDQTTAPSSDPKSARSAWDSALAPVLRGVGMLLLAGAFVPLLPGGVQAALLYFGGSVFLLGTVVGIASTVLYFRECIGTESFDDRKVVFFDRVERLTMPTWLQAALAGAGCAAFICAAASAGTPSVIAAGVVAAICAFVGVRTIVTSIRIWRIR
jgi:hypothetical protein